MKKYLLHFFAFFMLTCLSTCVSTKSPVSVTVKKAYFNGATRKIAVIDFNYEDEGEGVMGTTKYYSAGKDGGKVIANMLAAELNKIDNFQIVERAALSKVMEEQKLQVSGAVDESSAVEIGKMMGADAIILGEVTDYNHWTNTGVFGSTITFTTRMIDIESSHLILSTAISRTRVGVNPFPNVQPTVKELSKGIRKEL